MATATGNSLADIARREGVNLLDLIAANPQLRDPNLIRAGQQIRLPTRTYSPAEQSVAAERAGMSPTGVPGGSFTPQIAGQQTQQAPTVAPTAAGSAVPGLTEYLQRVQAQYGSAFNVTLGTPITPARTTISRGGTRGTIGTGIQPTAISATGQPTISRGGTRGTIGTGTQPSGLGQAVGGFLGGLGGGLVGAAGGITATYQQARQTGEGNLFNLASQGISNVLAGAYSGLQQGADIGSQTLGRDFAAGNPAFQFQPTPSAAAQPGVTTPTLTARGPAGGVYVSGVGYVFPQTTEQQFFGGSPDVAQLRTESWAKSVAVHASIWASQADIPSYTSLQLFIDAQAQLGNVLTPEQATQVLAGLGYNNITGSIWKKARDESYGTGSGAAAGGGYGSIIGSRGDDGGGGGGGGGTESGFRGGLATGLYQWRIGA